MYFRYFVITSPLEKGWSSFVKKKNLNSIHPRMHCVKFGLNWPGGLNFVNVFLLFRNNLPLEKGGALHLNKLESLLPKALCQVWLKLAQLFLKRRFLNFVKFKSTSSKNELCLVWWKLI